MYYTEIASGDAVKGVIVINDSVSAICKDVLEWIKEEDPKGLKPAGLFERETQKRIGTIRYVDGGLVIDPA